MEENRLPQKIAIYLTHKQVILLNMVYSYGAYVFCGDVGPAVIMHKSIFQFLEAHWTHEEKEEMADMISKIPNLISDDVKKELGLTGKITVFKP